MRTFDSGTRRSMILQAASCRRVLIIWKQCQALKSASTRRIWSGRVARSNGSRAKKLFRTFPARIHSTFDHDHLVSKQSLPYDWDPHEATSETWAGEDEPMAEYLASALRENGIPSHIPDEPGHRVRLCVRPEDLTRARDIVREITEGRNRTSVCVSRNLNAIPDAGRGVCDAAGNSLWVTRMSGCSSKIATICHGGDI